MKKLLAILGSITFSAAPASVTANVLTDINNTNDSNSDSLVTEEMQYTLQQLQNVIKGNKISDDKIIELLNKCVLGLDDIYNLEFYQKYMDCSWQLLSKYEKELTAIQYNENTTYYKYFDDLLNKLQNEEILKFSSKNFEAYKEYKEAKEKEEHLYFQVYNQFITNRMLNIASMQEQVNNLINENETLNEKIIGLNEKNKILQSIVKVMNETLKLMKTYSNQFNGARSTLQSKVKHMGNERKSSWTAYIPFGGSIFLSVYQDSMKDVTNSMKVFIDAFNDPDSEIAKNMDAFADATNSAMDKIKKGEDESLVDKICDATGITQQLGNLKELPIKLMSDFLEVDEGAISSILDIINDIITPWFAVGHLNDQEKIIDDKYKDEIDQPTQKINDENEKQILETTNVINSIQNQIKSNDEENQKMLNQINSNNEAIETKNKEIDLLNSQSTSINIEVIDTLSELMGVGFTSYWYGISMIDNNESLSCSNNLESTIFSARLQQYEDSISDENIKYNKLINIISDDEISKEWKNYLKAEHKEIFNENSLMLQSYKNQNII